MTTVNAEVKERSNGSVLADSLDAWKHLSLGNNFRLITRTDQIWEFQTQIRDLQTPRSNFTFVADRLIRTVIEEGLNQLPYTEAAVTTPTGQQYNGLRYQKGNCGVSIVRSGEAMEKALQDCCRSMRIGKILSTLTQKPTKQGLFLPNFRPT